MKKPKSITIKTGTVDEFMAYAKNIMRAADKGEPIKPSHTLVFEDPKEMLHFLSDKNIEFKQDE